MARTHGSWTGGTLTVGSFLRPHKAARAVFHPAWIPDSLDPSIERLKRFRIIAGAVASLGVYTFVEGGFSLTELMENALTASAVLLFLTPLTVGVMLFVWRRTGTVRQLRVPLLNALKLLLLFIGCVVGLVLLVQTTNSSGNMLLTMGVGLTMMWLLVFVVSGAVRVSGNFFGTAAVHRCLPALLATVTSWLMAIPDLVTGDLHGLGLTMGIVFILGAPVTVTAIALLETGRLKRRYGVRLGTHPASLPALPGPVPPMPPTGLPHVPPQGNPYGPPHAPAAGGPYAPYPQPPYAPGAGGNPYAPGPQHPHARPPYPPRNPHGPYGG
ncbi:proline-rich domain-containing protein [Streptomyces sp. Tu 3180]|uniref:proline-rich domain-containing protein n=1 Tax=Streptomyces sp. Tu 3180 TaxID=2682611 RepID=UPI00135A7955|nr:proline-rich domain-containing protein [Streptomyces sp. Tu 3180]KAF3464801.1 hypothetical protein GL259_11000 [Streptomyces sp. Tu 3180]